MNGDRKLPRLAVGPGQGWPAVSDTLENESTSFGTSRVRNYINAPGGPQSLDIYLSGSNLEHQIIEHSLFKIRLPDLAG
jgi:hypothetical protein